jgi:translation initiation factor eIF-2B subunit beta
MRSPPSTSSTTAAEDALLSSDPRAVRQWLSSNHPKQLQLLDKFEIELRLGRLAAIAPTTGEEVATSDRLLVTLRTVELLKHIIGQTRWRNAAQLLALLRGLGRELHQVGGFREPVIENIVRRVMAAVREEAQTNEGGGQQQHAKVEGGRLTLQSILWALPQQVKRGPLNRSASRDMDGPHQRTESFASESEAFATISTEQLPSEYFSVRPELKQTVMEAIQEIMTELEDLHRNINDQATQHIHAGEVILTYGKSKTVEYFLKAAHAKKRTFQVVVCEDGPMYGGHEMAKALAEAGIDTIVIHDSAVFAIMARVNKVLLSSHAVLANGGLVTSSGANLVAMAAHNNSVPVVCITGMFKLCPMFPHEGQDTLNDLISPSNVLDLAEMGDELLSDVELINPVHDYIKPEHISLYVTNQGSFQPSYIYRLLAEYYHMDDWKSFE